MNQQGRAGTGYECEIRGSHVLTTFESDTLPFSQVKCFRRIQLKHMPPVRSNLPQENESVGEFVIDSVKNQTALRSFCSRIPQHSKD
jgi:hypothetical protein